MNQPEIYATILDQSGPGKYSNTVALCVDENYLPYAVFVAMQINQIEVEKIDICICLPTLDIIPDSLKTLPIRFIAIDVVGINSLPTDHLSIAAYYRLFLPSIFANDYKHIIYLDADVYIRKPFIKPILDELKDNDYAVAAAPYMGEVELAAFSHLKNSKIQKYLSRYHELNHLYRNSGVLVFNVAVFNELKIKDRIFITAINNKDKLESHDQSALNLALLDEIALLPLSFNWQLNLLSSTVVSEIDPYIIHFVNIYKPWQTVTTYISEYIPQYRQFLETHFPETEFKPLTHKLKRKLNPKYSGIKELISNKWYCNKIDKEQIKLEKFYKQHKLEILEAVDKVNNRGFN